MKDYDVQAMYKIPELIVATNNFIQEPCGQNDQLFSKSIDPVFKPFCPCFQKNFPKNTLQLQFRQLVVFTCNIHQQITRSFDHIGRHATNLMQVVDFIGLMQVFHQGPVVQSWVSAVFLPFRFFQNFRNQN